MGYQYCNVNVLLRILIGLVCVLPIPTVPLAKWANQNHLLIFFYKLFGIRFEFSSALIKLFRICST